MVNSNNNQTIPFAGEHNMKYYTIYKITNLVNGKTYIGKHETSQVNDGYMGSGKHLKRAIAKYGAENFVKTILHVYSTEAEMNQKEKELVTEEWCLRKDNYNLCVGGQGGFGYINQLGINNLPTESKMRGIRKTAEKRRGRKNPQCSNNFEAARLAGRIRHDGFKGKAHSSETKQKIRASSKGVAVGEKNSQFGKVWITDGLNNKKISATDTVPAGWRFGRVLNKHVDT